MIDNLHYESGELEKVLESKTSPLEQKLFACLFTADKTFINRFLLELGRDLANDNASLGRVALFLTATHLTNGNLAAANQQFSQLTNSIFESGNLTSFFASLAGLIQELLRDDIKLEKTILSENGALIGDSHTLSLSYLWAQPTSEVLYLPGLTLRGLSSPQKNSYTQAIENATSVSLRKDHLTFSIGEIDARNLYTHFAKILVKKSYKDIMSETIRTSLNFVYGLRAPYQEFYIFNLPGFNPALVQKENLKHKAKIKSLYCEFKQVFSQTAVEIGFNLIDHKEMLETEHINNLIDHAHFHPSFYQTILAGYLSSTQK